MNNEKNEHKYDESNNQFDYHMKNSDRKSITNIQFKKRRILPFGIAFFDIILIIILFGIFFRPQMQYLEEKETKNEQALHDETAKFKDDTYEITVTIFNENKIFSVDLYVINKTDKDITINPSEFYAKTSLSDTKYLSKFKETVIKPYKGKHILIDIEDKELSNFWITVYFRNEEIYQSESYN